MSTEINQAEQIEQIARASIDMTSLLVKPHRMARILPVHPSTVIRWCREGRVPGARKAGANWVVPLKYLLTLTGVGK